MDRLIDIDMAPIGKGRGRAVTDGAGNARVVTPEKTRRWEAIFGDRVRAVLGDVVFEGPIRVDILAVLPRPQRLLRRRDPDGFIWCQCKPDKDNIEKAVLDAIRGHFRDDAQVAAGETLKVYAERDKTPRVIVRVRTLDQADSHQAWLAAASLGLVPSPQEDT